MSKATRLFTGTREGRIIEILQNARRAGATCVEISNQDGRVTVKDDGRGIEDFAQLLDLGGSGWEERLEASEDPAGVGLFSLAPREVTIRSKGKTVTIAGDGWTGAPVAVLDDPEPVTPGTRLEFADEDWLREAIEPLAVFTGMVVSVNGRACASQPFVSDQAARHPELGCRIEVRGANSLDTWQRYARRSVYLDGDEVLVNFHGQVVGFDVHLVEEIGLA